MKSWGRLLKTVSRKWKITSQVLRWFFLSSNFLIYFFYSLPRQWRTLPYNPKDPATIKTLGRCTYPVRNLQPALRLSVILLEWLKFFIFFILNYTCTDEMDSETENEGVNIDDSLLIVPWACILLLLSKCQNHGCSEQVLPSNVKISRKGSTDIRLHM